MVLMVVTTSSTIAPLSSSYSHTMALPHPATAVSFSNCNGQPAVKSPTGDVSPTSYQLLLKQVESLKKENSTLKAELRSNTTHINKLENEASRMKDMVLMLGSPALPAGGVESDYPVGNNFPRHSLPIDENLLPFASDDNTTLGQIHSQIPSLQSPMKVHNGLDHGENRRHRPEFLLGLAQSSHNLQNGPLQEPVSSSRHHHTTAQGLISSSPTKAVADCFTKILVSLKAEKANTLRILNLEEQKKEYYLTQLKELTSRLDNFSESDKFTKPNDKTRQQIEMEIANLKRTMEQSLGTGKAMQERLEARLKHIQVIESEIAPLEQHLHKLQMTPTSPSPSSVFPHIHPGADPNAGMSSQHGYHQSDGVSLSESSTQTLKLSSFEGFKYEEFSPCDNTTMDLPIASGNGRMSRTVQTVASCFTTRAIPMWNCQTSTEACGVMTGPHDLLTSRLEPKAPESIDSLPSQSDIDETASMHSFTTSLPPHFQSSLGHKKDGLLSPTLLQADREELCRRFQKMNESIEGCRSMKHTGCLPLIIQVIHDGSLLSYPTGWTTPLSRGHLGSTVFDSLNHLKDTRLAMGQVLWNIVNVTAEPKANHEIQIFKSSEILRRYCEQLYEFWIYSQTLKENKMGHDRNKTRSGNGYVDSTVGGDSDVVGKNEKAYDFRSGITILYEPPINEIDAIRKLSYYEPMKKITNEFGGLYAVAELFILHCRCIASAELVKLALGKDLPNLDDRNVLLLRRLVGFSLINLTYGDVPNKSILIQMPGLIDTLVSQMPLDSEEIQQVLALFVRNLSWQPDEKCREILRQKNVAAVFMKCALKSKREDTLKSLLSALWNLSGHCLENRTSICSVKGALAFLASTLVYRVPEVVESGGGILRNISSVVATNEEYRKILREKNCLQILLKQLTAPSLTVVSNACGTLWNLSARNAHDQKLLCDLEAVPMLKNLVHSKHSVISQGSAAALRNLLANKPGSSLGGDFENSEGTRLKARKQKGAESRTPPDVENFSPRHHAQSSAREKMVSPRSAMSPQRHSLQEKSSSSPVPDLDKTRRLQKGGLHYSGSLGSLPITELSDSLTKSHTRTKYIPAARNTNSYPDHYSSNAIGGFACMGRKTLPTNHVSAFKPGIAPVGGGLLKDVMMFSNVPQASVKKSESVAPNMFLMQYLKMLRERKMPRPCAIASSSPAAAQNLSATSGHEPAPTIHSPYYPSGLPSTAWNGSEPPTLAHPSGGSSNSTDGPRVRSMPHPQPHGVKKILTTSSNAGKMSSALVPKCTEDLKKILHNVEDDYENDDDPVNYSLQYRDEHMTPGIQSPRTEEIYEMAAEENAAGPSSKLQVPEMRHTYMHSQLSNMPTSSLNGPATKSDGGLSGLSSCIESTGSSAPQKSNTLTSALNLPSADRKPQSSLQPSARINGVTSSTDRSLVDPSKYDFISYEEEKPTNFGAIYSEEQLYEPIPHESMGMQPFTPTEPSEANQQSNTVDGSHVNPTSATDDHSNDASVEAREEHDKFDTGMFTPAHYDYSHRSGRNSGIMTPRTPLEDCTPMMFSRNSSLDSLTDGDSIHSSFTSEPASRMMSGAVSPSHLPDSPSQSMPETPRRSPPPRVVDTHPADAAFLERKQSSLADSKHSQRFKPQSLPPVEELDKPMKSSVGERIENQMKKLEQPGYVTSIPHKDEVNVFHSEGAMSVMTKFSALTIDSNDKVQPISNLSDVPSNLPTESTAPPNPNQDENSVKSRQSAVHNDQRMPDGAFADQRAVVNAGYITSLPTNDEIKNFMHEGSLSPMTSFSEISCLKADNEGFQKSSGSVFSVPNSAGSHRPGGGSLSFASRSSATGASVPPPPPDKLNMVENGATGHTTVTEEQDKDIHHDVVSPTSLSNDGENKEEDDEDSDSLPSSSSEDDELLQQCIQQAIPKKAKSSSRSASSRTSSRSSRSSKSRDKSSHSAHQPSEPVKKDEDRSITNPSPEVVSEKEKRRINIKQKIESANEKLKGVHIVDYIDNLIYNTEGDNENDEISQNSSAKTKQVIDNAEKLQQSYSVRKKLKETEKQSGKTSESPGSSQITSVRIPKTTNLLPTEPTPNMQSKLRIQSYIREGFTSYATEGTPIEMSRSTSLSNITIDSLGAEHQESGPSQNLLKTSHSEPDFQSIGVELPERESLKIGRQILVHTRNASVGGSELSSCDKDSREILEVLGKQIENLSLTTVENVIASQKDPGYVRSMPHSDEIRKYAAEGSQFGGTEFSALTIDSETKIAPVVPTEISHQETFAAAEQIVPLPHTELKIEEPTRHKNQSQNVRCDSSHCQQNGYPIEEKIQISSSKDVKAVSKDDHPSSWPTVPAPQPSSHYNDENDNLAMREEKRNYMIEDTPLNLSGPGSLSSLDFGSDDDNDLLSACISSALPPERKTSNPMYPAQLLLAPQNYEPPDTLGRYNNGFPDGKVDSPVGQQMPSHYPVPQNFQNAQATGWGILPNIQSPNMEDFALFQQEAEAISAELMQRHQQNRGKPMARTPDMPPSSSLSLTQPTDGFYHLSRQASMPDSDLSVSSSVLGERQVYDSRSRSVRSPGSSGQQKRKPGFRQQPDKASTQSRNQSQRGVKSGRKFGPGQSKDMNSARRERNLRNRAKDSSSGSSSSYQKQQRHRLMSGTSRSNEMCNCQISSPRPSAQYCCNNAPVSASASHITDGVKSPGRQRRKSTNSASKNSIGGCEHNSHHHHYPKATRPRNSSKNIHRPCVVQMYPALKDMAGVLEGVASVAARGDKVLADRPAHFPSNMSKKSSSSSLVRSATFINESPSQILLENMTQEEKEHFATKSNGSMSSSLSQSQNSSRSVGKSRSSPLGSSHSLKQKSQIPSRHASSHSLKVQSVKSVEESKPKAGKKAANSAPSKPKPKNIWTGIKKLLSPSEGPPSSKNKDKTKGTQKKGTPKRNPGSPKPAKTFTGAKTTLKKDNHASARPHMTKNQSGSSSLSLSSSASNNSSDFEIMNPPEPIRNTITPYGLLPKSPSVNAVMRRTVTRIPSSRSMGILNPSNSQNHEPTVWRKTPPNFKDYGSASPGHSSAISHCQVIASESKPMVVSGTQDIWVSKKVVAAQIESHSRSGDVMTSQHPQSRDHDLQHAGDRHQHQLSGPAVPGFQSPPRTQSPRVVQQVAPFNYKPSPRKAPENAPTQTEKNVYLARKISPDCKQTPV